MPKMKTRKAADKRFKTTKSGKIMHGHAYSSHLKNKKSSRRIRHSAEPQEASAANVRTLKRLLPYG